MFLQVPVHLGILLLFDFGQVAIQVYIALYNLKLHSKVEDQDEIETWMRNVVVTHQELQVELHGTIPLLKGWKYVLYMNNKALISLLPLSSLARLLDKRKHAA